MGSCRRARHCRQPACFRWSGDRGKPRRQGGRPDPRHDCWPRKRSKLAWPGSPMSQSWTNIAPAWHSPCSAAGPERRQPLAELDEDAVRRRARIALQRLAQLHRTGSGLARWGTVAGARGGPARQRRGVGWTSWLRRGCGYQADARPGSAMLVTRLPGSASRLQDFFGWTDTPRVGGWQNARCTALARAESAPGADHHRLGRVLAAALSQVAPRAGAALSKTRLAREPVYCVAG